uniref:Transposase n=1 Tax=Ascaris lumbricoides TaxID=6252 RepID=A0A0M3HUW7_ASCLU
MWLGKNYPKVNGADANDRVPDVRRKQSRRKWPTSECYDAKKPPERGNPLPSFDVLVRLSGELVMYRMLLIAILQGPAFGQPF